MDIHLHILLYGYCDNIFLPQAEGEIQYYTKSLLIDLRRNYEFKDNITIDIPRNIVPGSAEIEVSLVGDLLGPTIMNLGNLLTLPTGCGEQNLVHIFSNVIILDYLRNSRNLSPTIRTESVIRMESAYQQQLTYKRPDGSFSAFGETDKNGSIW